MRQKHWFLIFVLAASPALAADAEKTVRRPGAKALARTPAGIAGPVGGAAAFERVLTDEQRRKLRESMQASSGKIRVNQQEAMKLRRELQEAVLNGTAGENVIQEKAEAIAKLESEALAARMNAMAKIAASLTPEQKERIKELSEQPRPGRARSGDAVRPAREPAAPPPPEN